MRDTLNHSAINIKGFYDDDFMIGCCIDVDLLARRYPHTVLA